MARTTPSQERSRKRRDALLEAAIGILAEQGAKAVTHRAVAERAGLPPASTTYYFDSIEELTQEALRKHAAERVAELRELTERASAGGSSVEEVARRFAEALATRSRDTIVAQHELYLEAARNPALAPYVHDALDAFEQLTETSLAVLGARRPREAAGAFFALVEGFAMHRVASPEGARGDAESLFEAMRALFIACVMDDAELETWYARFRDPLAPTPQQAAI